MSRILPNGRLPIALCSVCKWEDHAAVCGCTPYELWTRHDITADEYHRMRDFELIRTDELIQAYVSSDRRVTVDAAPRQALGVRVLNAWTAFKFTLRSGHPCKHRLTRWFPYDADTTQIRWCRTCGHTEYRQEDAR